MKSYHEGHKIIFISKNSEFITRVIGTLNKNFIRVEHTCDKNIGLAKIIHLRYSLIVLEENDDNEAIRIIREKNISTPIVVISQNMCVQNKQNILQSGADMLIEKNWLPENIASQIKSMLKRYHPQEESFIQIKELILDRNNLEVIYKRKIISLRKREFGLLAYLASNVNRTCSREEIYQELWDKNEISSNTIDSHVNNIRKKLQQRNDDLIKTIHSQGYMLKIN